MAKKDILDNLQIAKAIPDDAEAIFNVQKIGWFTTYPNKQLGITERDILFKLDGENGELKSQNIEQWKNNIQAGAVFVARASGKVMGFVATHNRGEQNRIGSLYILPEAQGKGIGRILLDKAVESLGSDKDVYLDVASYNEQAIRFYKKYGFVESGINIPESCIVRFASGKILPEINMVLKREKQAPAMPAGGGMDMGY